jgi:cytochrome b pre-mRNA-processing protein 3
MTDGTDTSGGGLFSRDLGPPRRSSWVLRGVVLGVIAVVCVGAWVWVHRSQEGAIRAMSRAQQEALYKEAWADQRRHCLGGEGPAETASRCRQRAEFLLLFPQCDEACRKELAPSLQGAAP